MCFGKVGCVAFIRACDSEGALDYAVLTEVKDVSFSFFEKKEKKKRYIDSHVILVSII